MKSWWWGFAVLVLSLFLIGGINLASRFADSAGKAESVSAPISSSRPQVYSIQPLASAEPCHQWEFEAVPGQGMSSELQEMSGIAISRTWQNLLYHVNDSGNKPELLISDLNGENLRSIPFADRSSDVEDLALAACPWGGACLYIADTGDNFGLRSQRQIWGIEETQLFDQPRRFRIDLLYPEQKRFDIEAMVVSPDGREFSFFTKERAVTRVLQGRWDGQAPSIRLEQVSTIQRSMITGAALHPLGRRIMLLNVEGVLELSQDALPGFERRERTWFPYERRLRVPWLVQQEAITYGLDGRSFLYSSERKAWSRAPWGWVWARCQ